MVRKNDYGSEVLINYQGKFADGTVFDDNKNGEPLRVVLGARSLPPGLEEALSNMEPGEEKSIKLSPDKAFGQIDAEGIMELPHYAVPRAHELVPGTRIMWSSPQAPEPVLVTVAAVTPATVTLDFNHPLAGCAVEYWVKLVDIIAS